MRVWGDLLRVGSVGPQPAARFGWRKKPTTFCPLKEKKATAFCPLKTKAHGPRKVFFSENKSPNPRMFCQLRLVSSNPKICALSLSLSLIAKSDLCGASRTILILHDEKPCHLQISTFEVPFLKKKTVCISLHELF